MTNQLAMDNLSNNLEIKDLNINHGLTSFYVLSQENNSNQLLNQLMQIGNVKEFSEEIPTMNDVFINAVK